MFEKVVDCKNLPTLPAVAVELLEKTRDPDVQLGEIAKLVMTDQGFGEPGSADGEFQFFMGCHSLARRSTGRSVCWG